MSKSCAYAFTVRERVIDGAAFGVVLDAAPAAVRDRSKAPACDRTPAVFIIAGDGSMRQLCEALVRSAGWTPRVFASGDELLAQEPTLAPSCLILDANLPGRSALELQQRVSAELPDMPIVFVAGAIDSRTIVEAMKAGAAEFLTSPFDEDAMQSAINQALNRSRAALALAAEMRALQRRYASLSPRERDVMALVVSGLLNKQVAFELGVSEITVKAHRGRVMRKMDATSFAELVAMAARLGVRRQQRFATKPIATFLSGLGQPSLVSSHP